MYICLPRKKPPKSRAFIWRLSVSHCAARSHCSRSLFFSFLDVEPLTDILKFPATLSLAIVIMCERVYSPVCAIEKQILRAYQRIRIIITDEGATYLPHLWIIFQYVNMSAWSCAASTTTAQRTHTRRFRFPRCHLMNVQWTVAFDCGRYYCCFFAMWRFSWACDWCLTELELCLI